MQHKNTITEFKRIAVIIPLEKLISDQLIFSVSISVNMITLNERTVNLNFLQYICY